VALRTEQQGYSPPVFAIVDLFITLGTGSRPVGQVRPVLTADGKLDCAPK
jgi:hypothetical protein